MPQKNPMSGKKPTISTQSFLDIYEIRDNTVVMKDGTLRSALLVSSINFSLKSEEEQNAIIQAYVQFLNSLDHPMQIVVQSRKLDIDRYLDNLKDLEKQQSNELLKAQMADYRNYINELLEMAEIMTKRFYIVVPYDAKADGKKQKGFGSSLSAVFRPAAAVALSHRKFEEDRIELFKRVDLIAEGMQAMGIKAVPLDTQSLIELYYNSYNIEIAKQEKMTEVAKLNIEE